MRARVSIRHWLPVLALLAGALGITLIGGRSDGLDTARLTPFVVPALQDAGAPIRSADFAGAPVLINVWATWCVPCRQEHAQLLRIAASAEVSIVGIAWRDRHEDVLRWLRYLGDPYTGVGVDADGSVALALGVRAAPETLLVAADGRLLHRHVGPLDEDVWRDVLRPLLRDATANPPAAPAVTAPPADALHARPTAVRAPGTAAEVRG